MTAADSHTRAYDAWDRRAWAEARDAFAAMNAPGPDDLQRLAVAAFLSGDEALSADAWSRAYHAAPSAQIAARCAFWQAFQLQAAGEHARAGGWLTRAARLLTEVGHECAEHGLVQAMTALQRLNDGDPVAARAGFAEAVRTGQRFGDQDVQTLGRLGQGHALIELGRSGEGMALLDEVMVAVTTDEVSPVVAGLAYCAVIGLCRENFDLRRAAEWTTALISWCGAQPELMAYRGQCLIHRSEVLQLRGNWPEAMAAAALARRRLSEPMPRPALGMALYQQAELHRLRGDLGAAEAGYADAVRWGSPPQPGFALLRLAQGRTEAALAVINRLLGENSQPTSRCRLLPARVEIGLAAGDLAGAREAADELEALATELDAAYVAAVAAHARGAVLLASGDAPSAQGPLRRALAGWQELDVPYEAARTRALLATACAELGDPDSARLERDAALATFAEIGAALDAAALDHAAPDGLTQRELQVLRLLAGGHTNRAIAHRLSISDKTVARHISNIFTKLGISSRTAAAAYAYEHRLV